MKIECHILQNFAPSCLNRDDTNTPKECEFGGVRRARISSQSFKRAIREHFRTITEAPAKRTEWTDEQKQLLGDRTKAIKVELRKRLPESKHDDAEKFVTRFISDLDDKRSDETVVLAFLSQSEVDAMQICIEEGISDKKEVAKRLSEARLSVDIALFGRMLANKNASNKAHADRLAMDEFASCQVAHALSTHATELEMDFFTAVDDLNPRDDVGAGMLGYVGYSSACLYRYALLDTVQLRKNLNGDSEMTKKAVEAFLWAFCDAEPSARQNSMPAHNRPSLALFVARKSGIPTSLANAFCKPVRTRSSQPDLLGESVAALDSYHERLGRVYEAFDGATQTLFHDLDEEQAAKLKTLKAFDLGSQRKAINEILDALEG
jgi:CRISPR system Cascade subunit CasC